MPSFVRTLVAPPDSVMAYSGTISHYSIDENAALRMRIFERNVKS
jgi:hypothetical protein